jgi:hypothetical protein
LQTYTTETQCIMGDMQDHLAENLSG